MRYFLVTYFRRATGKMDEQVHVAKRLRTRDLQTASVILDFRDRRVLISSLDGNQAPKDFDRIRAFYLQYYQSIIEELEQINGLPQSTSSPDTSPVSN
jgi:hypothetical protein